MYFNFTVTSFKQSNLQSDKCSRTNKCSEVKKNLKNAAFPSDI